MAATSTRVLLPTDVIPVKYNLHLTPNFNTLTFKGDEIIDVQVKNATTTVVLHSNDIKIESATFVGVGDAVVTVQDKEQTATLVFPASLPTGTGKLHIKYEGNLNDQMVGFYRSKVTVNGKEKYMATTQFEATDARRAFPCWDEPAHKAVFDVTLTIPGDLHALSNMPVKQENTNPDGTRTLSFFSSPIMSTYLLAFVVGEFDHVEGKTKEGVTVRVYTPVGKKEQGTFALDVAVRTLSYFSHFFEIAYPLPKLDMIAIADFAAGAMENWGLVTYRETALLIDEKTSGIASRQRVAYVVAHELAHQWFGNLVTMEWWKELWLNEGFATFVGNQAVDHLFPEWDTWTQFLSQYHNKALELDSLESSHPIEVEVRSSGEINEIFDAISYNKGAVVIRMIANVIGNEAFRKGLVLYLNTHKYKNAVTQDLWAALSTASGFPVSDFMNNWTKLTGFPLLSVKEGATPGDLTFEQTRFFGNGKQEAGQLWSLSIPVRTGADSVVEKFNTKAAVTTFKVHALANNPHTWVKVNANQTGFFRVKYTSELASRLLPPLSSLALPTVDRLAIQNDAFALAKAGLLSTREALAIASAYVNETDYTVWADLIGSLSDLASVWCFEPTYPDLKNFIRKLLGPISSKLGWDARPGESSLDSLLRPVVLSALGSNGDKEVIAEAHRRFAAAEKDPSTLPADLRFVVYKLHLANSEGREAYDTLKNMFIKSDGQEEKLRALRALGATKDKALIHETLKFALSDAVRSQDIFFVIGSTAHNPASREDTWKFLQSDFSDFMRRLGDSQFLLARIISLATKDLNTLEYARQVEEFFKEHPVPQAERSIKQSLESIRANANWLNSSRDDVAAFLASQK